MPRDFLLHRGFTVHLQYHLPTNVLANDTRDTSRSRIGSCVAACLAGVDCELFHASMRVLFVPYRRDVNNV